MGCLCDYMVLPLLNSSFEPGRAREVVEGFVDVDLRNIARADRGLYPESGSGGVSAYHERGDFFQQGLDGAS